MTLRQITRIVPLANKRLMDEQGIKAITKLCDDYNPTVVVEIGTLLAMGSTRVLAQAVRKRGGFIVCVDPCATGCAKAMGRTESHYHLLLSNMLQHPDLIDTAILFRGTSAEAADALTVQPDMVFIDGDHRKAGVLADIALWKPKLRPGGVLAGDDYEVPTCLEVAPAVKEALPNHKHDGRIWWTIV